MPPSAKILTSEQKILPKQTSEVGEIEKEKIYESIEEEDEQKRVIINESVETPQHRHNKNPYRPDERPHKVPAPVKINPHALFKKDDDSEQGELSLKYEYLKKHAHDEKAQTQQDTGSNEPNPWQHLEHSKSKEIHRPSDIAIHERNPVSSEKNINYAMKNKKKNLYSRNGRERNNNRNEYNEARLKTDYGSNSRPQFKSGKIPSLPVIDIDENGERKIEEITEEPLEQQKPVINEEVLQGGKIRKSWGGTAYRGAYSEVEESNPEEPDNDTQDSRSNPGYELGELTTTKRVIRKEGSRYYTYLSGPEYAEFHQQLANERRKDEEFH
ncbi:unnamed protein product [Arctia plantaginis]|uniref:Uncharacterized protein n=1 Tax=Arctia plantaginis TaxID=874455 RepID=A0A8S0ZX16_ARCPL|nr:unnamed protein product [Arctia plantaginis]